jgi:hypothetical protein
MIIDKDGALMIIALSPDGSSRIVKTDIGVIDYTNGEMFLDSFRPLSIADGSDYVYFVAKPRINDIIPRENTIITIDSSDITVNVIDDNDRIVENKTRGY